MEFNQTCVALDLETTGLRSERDAIIEIGAVKFQGERIVGRWHSLVKPRHNLPLRTKVITGISATELERAPSFSALAGELAKFVGNHPIVGQSPEVDLSFLERYGLSLPNVRYDTFDLASILLPDLEEYSLGSIARFLGIPIGIEHRALEDALITRAVFVDLARRALELDLGTISEIARLTAPTEWHLRHFFKEVERLRSRAAFSTTIGEQLAGKLDPEDLGPQALIRDEPRPPLSPNAEDEPIPLEEIDSLFGPDGLLAQRLAKFEDRTEQRRMALAVTEALNEDRSLIIEAGTGVGKSLAYLLPALLFAVRNGRRVVISTNTINLQEQLISKDLPDLFNALEGYVSERPRAAVLKGRSNYLCLRRWNRLRRSENLTLDEIKVLCRLLVWLPRTATGDRSELNLTPGELAVWNQICAQEDTCQPGRCGAPGRGKPCYLHRARQRAESAHLVVVNHALLLSDVAANGQVLPEHEHLIIDEAHHLEDEATRQFGFEVSFRQLQEFFDALAGPSGGLVADAGVRLRGSTAPANARQQIDELTTQIRERTERGRLRATDLFTALQSFHRAHLADSGDYDRRVRLTQAVRNREGWSEVETAWENLGIALADVGETLGNLFATFESLANHKVLDLDGLLEDISSLGRQAHEFRTQLTAVISSPDPTGVYWTTIPVNGGGAFCAAPLEVGPMLEKALFDTMRSVVLTSATLSTSGSIDFAAKRLGLTGARQLVLGSPFDYDKSTLLFVTHDIPEPNHAGYQRSVERAVLALCRASEGRALVLFTSHSAVRSCHAAIRSELEREGILVLGHGIDGSRKQLLNTFRRNPRTVLLGTNSFWEGIDVVGDALSLLIIAKLPFSVPSDPIYAARSELFEQAFTEYAVPQAIIKFKQGFGRLIRSRDDRGVVVVLDRRIVSKAYGQAFFASLPSCTRQTGPVETAASEIKQWLSASATVGEALV